MIKKREELLQSLIEKLTHVIHMMHHNSDRVPFYDSLLSKQQIMILFFIWENDGETSVKDVAKFLHVTSGAVTQFVDSLVENKIVIREENSLDRRSINLKLTTGAKKQFNDFKKKYIESASKSFSDISDQELMQFIGLVEKIKVLG